MSDFSTGSTSRPLSEGQIALLRATNPIIDINGPVEPPMFEYVRAAILYLRSRGNPDVDVYISSPGGRVDVGLDIYDLLRLYPGKKTATVFGHAESMGALILQACSPRRCPKHSHVLIHHISTSRVTLDRLRSPKRMKVMRDDMERDQKRLYDILSARTGKTIPLIRKVCAKDEHMTAEEALEFGLIDEII